MASRTYSLLVGNFGLDLRNVKSQADDTFLISAKNVICRQGFIENRKHAVKRIGFEKAVGFIYPFDEYNLIIAATEDTIYLLDKGYNIIKTKSGFSNANWTAVYFNHRVFLANGIDPTQQIYSDGLDTYKIEEIDTTGTSGKVFSFVSVVNNQLVFGTVNKLSFWYLAPGDISGELKEFNLYNAIGTTRSGGILLNMCNVPRDSGIGIKDYIAMFTSMGEIIVYSCTDFSNPDTIQYNATYVTYPFVGKNFITKYGNDLLLITTNGITTFGDVVSTGLSDSTGALFSAPINQQFSQYNFAVNGFQGVVVPQEDIVLFNIPRSTGESTQWVMDLATHRWSSFVDIHAKSMANINDTLLFGMSDGIYEYSNSGVPGSAFVVSEIKTSYTPMGSISNKQFNLFNARIQATSKLNVNYTIQKDLEDSVYYDFISDSNIVPSIPTDYGFFTIDNAQVDARHADDLFYWQIDDESVDNKHKLVYWNIGQTGDYSEDAKWHSGTGLARNFSLTLKMKTSNVSYRLYDIIFKYTEAFATL